jgi:hypothetical protein
MAQRYLKKQSKVLKEGAILALCDAQSIKTTFTTNKKTTGKFGNQKIKIVIHHQIRGSNNIQSIKKEPKLMDYLKNNNICKKGFFFRSSIKTITSFEYDKSVNLNDFSKNNSGATVCNPLSPELTALAYVLGYSKTWTCLI